MTLGDLIRQHRKLAGLTQRALAAKLQVDKSAIPQWEGDITRPTVANMAALKLELNITSNLGASETGPYAGELVEDPDELSLLGFWRRQDDVKRRALTDLLRIGEAEVRKAI